MSFSTDNTFLLSHSLPTSICRYPNVGLAYSIVSCIPVIISRAAAAAEQLSDVSLHVVMSRSNCSVIVWNELRRWLNIVVTNCSLNSKFSCLDSHMQLEQLNDHILHENTFYDRESKKHATKSLNKLFVLIDAKYWPLFTMAHHCSPKHDRYRNYYTMESSKTCRGK